MSLYTFNLKAGQEFHRVVIGKMILVDSTGEAESVTIKAMRGSQEVAVLPERQKAFKCWVDYDSIILRAEVECTIRLFLSMTDVSLGFADGANVNVRGGVSIENDPDNRVPVDIGGGVVTVTASGVEIHNKLGQLTHLAPLPVGTVAVQVSNDNTLKRLRFRNGDDAAQIALGGAGVTMANAVIVLGPGDIWVEDSAPGATWFAVSDTAGASLKIMGMK